MRKFRFIWKGGKEDVGEGLDVDDAFRRLGYGGGAIAALDYYKEETDDGQTEPANQADITTDLLSTLKRAAVLVRLLTVHQVLDAGDAAIEAAGLNPWCVNEGLATGNERLDCWWIGAIIEKAAGTTSLGERKTATTKEHKLAAYLLRMASNEFSNHGCNDMDQQEMLQIFTEDELREFAKEYVKWNGDPDMEEWVNESKHPFKCVGDSSWMDFIADKLEGKA